MTRGFLPNTDSGLANWSVNFLNLLEASWQAYGVSADQLATYGQLHQDYVAALQTSVESLTRGPSATFRKNEAREALKAFARLLGKMISSRLDVTDQQRFELGLTVPKQRSRISKPAEAPVLTVQSVNGQSVSIWLYDATSHRVRLPDDVAAASVFYAVGDAPPSDPADWVMMGTTTRARLRVEISADVPPGSRVWLTACWLNPRSQRGPSAQPTHTYTQFGGVMRLAA